VDSIHASRFPWFQPVELVVLSAPVPILYKELRSRSPVLATERPFSRGTLWFWTGCRGSFPASNSSPVQDSRMLRQRESYAVQLTFPQSHGM